MIKITTLGLVATIFVGLSSAAYAKNDFCSGVLHKADDGDLAISVPPEAICIIKKADAARVLRTCRIGQECRVNGIIDDCEDSGECAEFWRVRSVQRLRYPNAWTGLVRRP